MKKGLLLICILTICGCGKEAKEKRVLAFYYPWYGTPEVSGEWIRWNIAGHNPEVKDENGLRDIAAAHHPYPDIYDSYSSQVIERHLNVAENYGIDGFIVSWWGRERFEDKVLRKIFEVAESIDTPTQISIYYEQTPDFNPEKAVEDIIYLQQFFYRDHYFKWKGKPVLFIYGRAIFPAWWCISQWCPSETPTRISWKSVTEKFPDVIFVADDVNYFLAPLLSDSLATDGFSGLHIYNPLLDILSGMEIGPLYRRFTSISRSKKLISALTVIPGYDDTKTGRNITFVLEREEGSLYKKLWEQAIQANPNWILITSFNEWHEGTEIEESYEFGDYYLNTTLKFSQEFKEQ